MDTGLSSLIMMAKYHDIAVNPQKLHHEFKSEDESFDSTRLILAAKSVGLKAKSKVIKGIECLESLPLPVIIKTHEDEFNIIGKIDSKNQKVLIFDPVSGETKSISYADAKDRFSYEIILLTKKFSLSSDDGDFGFSWFIPAFWKYRWLLKDVVIAAFVIQILALVSPLFFQVIVDKVLVHRGLTTLDLLIFGLITVSVFEVILTGLKTYLFSHTTNRIDVTLGAKLFGHLMRLPISYFSSRNVGQTVARVRELENIRRFISGASLTLVVDLAFTVIFFAVMYYYSPAMTFIVLGSVPLYILLAYLVTPVLHKRLDDKFKYGAENQSFLVETITGIETIKGLAIEPRMKNRWNDILASYVKASFKVDNLSNWYSQSNQLISKVVAAGILWLGAQYVLDGTITAGQLIAFNILASRVSGPILRLSQLWQDFQQASISVKRLGDILNSPAEKGTGAVKSNLSAIKGNITFKNVVFRYNPDQRPIINDVSITANAGEIIGIVGSSGSGKSTLTKLLQRLYVPENGFIHIDGIDISSVDPAWLRHQIGYVLQDSFLFNKTVRENIAITDPGAPMDKIEYVAKLAGAHEFIIEMRDGYDTIIEEQGRSLSGGQRQRIAIARALLNNPKILIFDEATSALDYESERVIQENMKHICRDRTVFVIAHRLSTIRNANKIIVMEQGKVVEQGSHEELLNRTNGYYSRLHKIQSGGT